MADLFDPTFPHNYTAAEHKFDAGEYAHQRQLVSLGSPAKPLFVPPEIEPEIERTASVCVQIAPQNGSPWTGVFACGFDSPNVASGLYSTPHPDRLCVVAAGYGYIVNVLRPIEWERLISQPVLSVRCAPRAGLLLFSDFTNIAAYGAEGIVWRSHRLTWDGIRITEVTDTSIHGFGWDMPADREVPFTVDLKTGDHVGGAAPGN